MDVVIEIIGTLFSWIGKMFYTIYIWLTHQGIVNKKRKKIFIFGMPHSSKSTIMKFLIKYLDLNYKTHRDPKNNPKGVKVIRSFIIEENFPLQTPKDEFTQVHFEYNDKDGKLINKLYMYEIAGEDVLKFDPTDKEHNNIPIELVKFFKESQAIMIMASSKPEREDEAEIIRDFIESLLEQNIKKPICFVLTKYDLIEKDYQNPVEASKAIYPGAIKLLLSYNNSEVLAFSVGIVENEEIIEDKSKKYILNILKWIEGI